MPISPGASPEGSQELVEVGQAMKPATWQQVRSSFHKNDDRITNLALLADKGPVSLPLLSDAAYQTETPITQDQSTRWLLLTQHNNGERSPASLLLLPPVLHTETGSPQYMRFLLFM